MWRKRINAFFVKSDNWFKEKTYPLLYGDWTEWRDKLIVPPRVYLLRAISSAIALSGIVIITNPGGSAALGNLADYSFLVDLGIVAGGTLLTVLGNFMAVQVIKRHEPNEESTQQILEGIMRGAKYAFFLAAPHRLVHTDC